MLVTKNTQWTIHIMIIMYFTILYSHNAGKNIFGMVNFDKFKGTKKDPLKEIKKDHFKEFKETLNILVC